MQRLFLHGLVLLIGILSISAAETESVTVDTSQPITAVAITATNTGNNQLLYFTSSSLTADDRHLVFISDRTGNPNLFTRDLATGQESQLTANTEGVLKSYVYFDGHPYRGFGKSSVSLDSRNGIVYYIQGREIRAVTLAGKQRVLAELPTNQMTAFTHISADGSRLCVPTTDARALDGDTQLKGKPGYDIDKRVVSENLSSYLRIFDTTTGKLIACERVPQAWITHVQFSPVNPDLILYNNEWPADCGIRRIWLWDGKTHLRRWSCCQRVVVSSRRGLGDGRNLLVSVSTLICMNAPMNIASRIKAFMIGAVLGFLAYLIYLDFLTADEATATAVGWIYFPPQYLVYWAVSQFDLSETAGFVSCYAIITFFYGYIALSFRLSPRTAVWTFCITALMFPICLHVFGYVLKVEALATLNYIVFWPGIMLEYVLTDGGVASPLIRLSVECISVGFWYAAQICCVRTFFMTIAKSKTDSSAPPIVQTRSQSATPRTGKSDARRKSYP